MANKITKKDNFKRIIEVLKAQGENELVKVIEHEIELIDKKANSAKMTKTQEANEVTKELILNALIKMAKPVTITELINGDSEVAEAVGGSNQKASALMTQLKNVNKVTRIQEGKKAMFTIAE